MADWQETLLDSISSGVQGVASTARVLGKLLSFGLTEINLLPPPEKVHRQESAMTVTEIASVFNTTDEVVQFMNMETPSDSKKVPAQSVMSLQTAQTAGAYIPWYDPPVFGGWSRRHMKVVIEDTTIAYFFQRGDFIYWCNTLGNDNLPGRFYKVPGVSTIGGKRVLVVRYDREQKHGFFLAESSPVPQQDNEKPGGLLPRIL
jgi:hypothetical protein